MNKSSKSIIGIVIILVLVIVAVSIFLLMRGGDESGETPTTPEASQPDENTDPSDDDAGDNTDEDQTSNNDPVIEEILTEADRVQNLYSAIEADIESLTAGGCTDDINQKTVDITTRQSEALQAFEALGTKTAALNPDDYSQEDVATVSEKMEAINTTIDSITEKEDALIQLSASCSN